MTNGAIIYARVSTREQEELSIPVQKESCQKYADEHQLKVVKIFDEARSGFVEKKRIAYYDMLSFIEQEKTANMIYLLPDRLSRNPEDFEQLIKLCREVNHNLILHDVYKRRSFGILDTEAYEELAQMRKDIIDAGLFSARNRFRVGRSIKKLLEKGIYPGYAPVGYLNKVGTGKIIVDSERAPLIIKAFNLMATGDYSSNDITIRMRNEGLTVRTPNRAERELIPQRLVNKAEMFRILIKPFYYGWFPWSGKLWNNRGIDGKGEPSYEPLIDNNLFDQVQAVFKKNRGKRMIRKGRPFLYRGLLECRYCGCSLVGEGHPKGPYTYYRCTYGKKAVDPHWYKDRFGKKNCIQKFWKEREITAAIEKALDDLKFDQETFDHLKKSAGEEILSRHVCVKQELKLLQKRQTEIKNENEQLFRAKMTGKLDEAEFEDYRRVREKNIAELAEIESQIQEIEAQDISWIDSGVETLIKASSFANIFKTNQLSKNEANKDSEHGKDRIYLKTIFIKIIAGDPLPHPKYGNPIINSYNGLEFIYNEPFDLLFDLKLMEKAEEWEKEVGYKYRIKEQNWRGRRDSNSRPPA